MASVLRRNPKKEPPECERLAELRRLINPYKWRWKWRDERMSEGMSEEAASMLALVVFDGYEF